MEEEWVFLGESGSDAETVCSVDDEGSETGFAMVQLRRSHAAESRAKADGCKNQGDHEEESDDDDDYFDLDLPALSGSKAVFGANGDCFDLDLALSILSMGSVGYDSGIYGADNEDDIDTVSLGAADVDGDGTVKPERVLCAHCANMDTDQSSHAAELVKYDDIDTGSSDDELSDEDDTDQSSDMAELGKYDDIDTCSSDSWESDYGDNGELSDEENTDDSDAAATGEHSADPKVALHEHMEDNTAPRQRRLRPPCAPHLFFTQRSRSTYKSTDAAEDETASYPDAAEGDKDDDIESSDEDTESSDAASGDNGDDDAETSYTSLTHRDGVISDFVTAALTRADALVLFDNIESALELPEYSLSRSDINAWKAALGKGRAQIAARPRPPFAPHLFFTRPSRST